MGLRARLLLLVLLAVIPGLLLSVLIHVEQRQSGRARAEKDATRLAQLAAANQLALIEATRQHLKALARLPEVRGSDLAVFENFFAGMRKAYTNYTDFGLIETNGNLVACSVPGNAGRPVAGRPDFQHVLATREFAAGEFQASQGPTKASLLFANPVFDQKGQLARVIYAALDLNALNRTAAEAQLPEGGAIEIFDEGRHILARFPEPDKWIGRSVADSSLEDTVMRREEGTLQARGLDGTERLCAFTTARIGRIPALFVVVGIPTGLAFGEAKQAMIRNLVVLGVVALLALLGAWIYANSHILNPVKTLVHASHRLAAGDLSARAGDIGSSGEFSQLTRAFDEMAASLQRQRQELESSQNALRQSEERTRMVLDTALDAVITIDESGRVTSWNREAERIFGWNSQEMIGQKLATRVIPPRFHEAHDRGLKHFLATGNGPVLNKRVEIMALRRNGEEFPVELAITPIRLRDHFTFSAFVRDITERKKAEQEIQALNAGLEQRVLERTKLLEEANTELEAFSYSVSHDLRAPLRHIHGYTEMLQEDFSPTLGEPGRRTLNVIQKAADQMGLLIDDLLDFSRMGRTEMHRGRVEIGELVREVISEMESDTQGRTIEWKIDTLPEVLADRSMLKLVWTNLLGNGVKYTRHRDHAQIEIKCMPNGEAGWQFSVKDNGAGFDMQYADKLFGVFQRLHPEKEFEGTGIGLANVRRIVQRHGGTAWAEGEVNKGATFYFTLPR